MSILAHISVLGGKVVLAIEVLLILAVVILVSFPLFWKKEELLKTYEPGEVQELLSKKETFYTAIKDLEFDYATGKIDEEDYQKLKERFKFQAASLLKQMDRKEKGEDLEQRIEQEIQALRKAKVKKAPLCPQCGQKYSSRDKFCPSCGAPLGLRCSNCGTKYQKGDKFCSGCGQKIS